MSSRIVPEEGTLQDMCKADLLMIQRLPRKEHVEVVLDTTTTPCISVVRSKLTYDALRRGRTSERDYTPAGSFSICNGVFTQVYGDTTVTTADGFDYEIWKDANATHLLTQDEKTEILQEKYTELVEEGVATIKDGYFEIVTTGEDGSKSVTYVSIENYLTNSEIFYSRSGKWLEKYFYQYQCAADGSYIPFIIKTYTRDTSSQCGTPYIFETLTQFNNYQKTSK